jgi:thiamine biosynthesis protein ThiS
VFLLGVPFMVLLLVVGPRVLPEFRAPAAGRLDPVSVALSLAAILPAIYGTKELAVHGAQAVPVAALVAGLGLEPRGIAVAVDGEVVTRRLWGERALAAGERVEVLSIAQGG